MAITPTNKGKTMTSKKEREMQELYDKVMDKIGDFDRTTILESLECMMDTILPAINKAHCDSIASEGNPLSGQSVYMSLLILERVHRRCFKDVQKVSDEKMIEFIRAARAIGDAIYDSGQVVAFDRNGEAIKGDEVVPKQTQYKNQYVGPMFSMGHGDA